MSEKIILKAQDLEGLLTAKDKEHLDHLEGIYQQAMESYLILSTSPADSTSRREKDKIIAHYNTMGRYMKTALAEEKGIQVYCFETPRLLHAEASRIIAKLRDTRTDKEEFVYYTQRAFEMLFNLAWGVNAESKKNYFIVKTPVTHPVQNYAVHKIPDVDAQIENSVMCVMLRGALLPSMILSKEIEENSSTGYATPFALFRIKRDDTRKETDMEYILDLKKSFFNLEELQDKDLIFADPMNATAGSLVTVVKYLQEQGIRPRSIKVFNMISSFKGALHAVRALKNLTIYTLWMDPVLNELAYILPGLGDAGDRLNGKDEESHPRNMIQLLGDYGSHILALYRSQVRNIEKTILE
ncbi:MAG: uracil phosphoribosyltransferase [Spirochaetes bacterium GWB1_48_6]|nr:MAG: uracil phosphoribosyltransferase [Spirochaetes bacterium GWB1_48_6]